MQWYDGERSSTPVFGTDERGFGRRDPSPEESPLRVRKQRDNFYEDIISPATAVDDHLRVGHVLDVVGDDGERRYGGDGGRDSGGGGGGSGERRRRRRREDGAEGGGDTLVVLKLLEEALSRLKGRRPSTAVRGSHDRNQYKVGYQAQLQRPRY